MVSFKIFLKEAEKNASFTHAAGAILYDTSTKKLGLAKRSKVGDYEGYWTCLGGKIEKGESILEGMIRELEEEAGIHTSEKQFILIDNGIPKDNFRYHTYWCIFKETPKIHLNDEHTEFRWFEYPDFPGPLHPGLVDTLCRTLYMKKVQDL